MSGNERGKGMREEIQTFINYMEEEKHASKNTTLSYQRSVKNGRLSGGKRNHRLRESDKDGVKFLYPFPGERRKSNVDSFEGTGIHEIVLWLAV